MASRQRYRDYSLEELLDRLRMSYTDSGKMDCPFCGTRRKVNLNFETNFWRCPKCESSGGVLHLFARLQLGIEELPADKEKKGEIAMQLREFMDGGCSASPSAAPKPKKPPRPVIQVAMDEDLNAVYTAMQKIPALQLLPEHKQDLLKRGLTEDVIRRNGYLSIPEIMPAPDLYVRMYEEQGGEERRRHTLRKLTPQQIIFGLLIAHSVESQGLSLQGVPGFFKFGERWCYWCPPGMLIPTRNINGQIVIYQVRQKAHPKYMTVSWENLPGHVNVPVSRCHFPLGNAPLSKETPVLVTEGPLKADIACFLWGKPAVFAAIPGISTTSDLLRYSEMFKSAGITEVNNALDMDRLTNPNVRKGSKKLVKNFRERGIVLRDLYWGTQYATYSLLSLSVLARHRNVPVKIHPKSNVFEQLNHLAAAMEAASINAFIHKDDNGKKVEQFWDPETKGIDDYLLHRR